MKIPVSTGELVDKVSILAIKLSKIQNEAKRENVLKEYQLLLSAMQSAGIELTSTEFEQLKAVNLMLWEIEDRIRVKEGKKEFDDDFIQLARSVYFRNDERAAIKRRINDKYHSELVEEKEYREYS